MRWNLRAGNSISTDKEVDLQKSANPSNFVDPGCGAPGLVPPDHLARNTKMCCERGLTDTDSLSSLPDLLPKLPSPSHSQLSFEGSSEFCVDQEGYVNYSLLMNCDMEIKVSKRRTLRRKKEQLQLPNFDRHRENPWSTKVLSINRNNSAQRALTTLELCAGAGGQALGFEQAGIGHAGLVEIDRHACDTLRLNRPTWNVVHSDIKEVTGSSFKGVDIVSGGLPCPPFSVAGKQLGERDERNLFPTMVRLVSEIRPSAVMIENVRGILDAVFEDYRSSVSNQLRKLGYEVGWKLMNAGDFGVPQLRPRVIFVALRQEYAHGFIWPDRGDQRRLTVGQVLYDLMAASGWRGAKKWRERANEIAPTVVGGSLKHGGPDLGPTRARRAWATLGVDGLGIANGAPVPSFEGMPRLTVRMVARLQGFPDDWLFAGTKTQSYRQVGNAFPPPFARAVAENIGACLLAAKKRASIAV